MFQLPLLGIRLITPISALTSAAGSSASPSSFYKFLLPVVRTVINLPLAFFPPQVWSLEQPDWHCKIDEGSAGLVSSCWSPDGRHILNTTEFHVSVG